MTGLADRLLSAQAEVARLERMIAAAPCGEVGHRWESFGGKNAGCGDHCGCSVPVHVCAVCGDCDYGDNAEAEETIRRCKEEA